MPSLKGLARLALAALVVATSSVALAQAWPARPVRIIVPSPPGDGSDATARAIAETRTRGGRVVSIGTTALRLLETVARDRAGVVTAWTGETDIFITPGYRFRAVDLLLTNFHLPRSTLFMLVAAFAGLDRMKASYAHAVRERYRFYSYGDCCLLRR